MIRRGHDGKILFVRAYMRIKILRTVFLDSQSSSASEVSRQQSQQLDDERERKPTAGVGAVSAAALKKKKKKKSHSLVRKLSLNKFRLSSEQDSRQTPPEGGDSGRSQSQSSQESPVHGATGTGKKGQEDDALERDKAKGELKKSEKLPETPLKTVTVVQRRSPSLTSKSFSSTVQQQQQGEVILALQSEKSRGFLRKRIRKIGEIAQ